MGSCLARLQRAPADFAAALAERDAQISELQQAFLELANSVETTAGVVEKGDAALVAALSEKVSSLESRLVEQDRTVRHTLTMLIEWIEEDLVQRAAA